MKDTNISIAENQELIRQKAVVIAQTIDPAKPETLTNFGVETQRKLGHYSNELLTKVKVKDSGDAGAAINELLNQINMVKVDESDKPNRLSRMVGGIPFLNKFVDKSKRIASRYNTISENVDEVVIKLERTRQSILKDSTSLEVMFNQAVEYIHEIRSVIAAGKMKIEEIEHTGVAYDTWLHATREWPRAMRWKVKAKVMLFVTRNFVIDRSYGTLELLRQDGITGSRAWARMLWFTWVRPGMMRKILGAWAVFLLPGFHPWRHDDRHLIEQAERSLEAQGEAYA